MWDGRNWADLSDLGIEGAGLKARVIRKPGCTVPFRRGGLLTASSHGSAWLQEWAVGAGGWAVRPGMRTRVCS